jgi:protease IV
MYRKASQSSFIFISNNLRHPLHLPETPHIHKSLKFYRTLSSISIVDRVAASLLPTQEPTLVFSSSSTSGNGNGVDFPKGEFDFVPHSGFKKFIVKVKTLLASEHVEHGSILRINLQGNISDGPVGTDSKVLSLPQLSENLMKAAFDPRVSAVFLNIVDFYCGWAKCDEIRRQISNFKKSGKKVIAFMASFWSFEPVLWCEDRSYYIASVCDEIYAPPKPPPDDSPDTSIDSPVNTDCIYYNLVEVQYRTAGKYKSGHLTTDEGWESMKAVKDDIRCNWLVMVSSSRKIREEEILTFFGSEDCREVENWIDCRLLSGLMASDKIITGLSRRFGPLLDFKAYSQVKKCTVGMSNGREKIGVIRVCGSHNEGAIHDLIEIIRGAGSSKSLKAVILRIDSPGGEFLLADQLWREVNILASKIPVVSSLSDKATSGAYLIATGAGTIVAEKLTYTCQIGAINSFPNTEKLYKYIGFKKEVLHRGGKYAELFEADHRPIMPHEDERIINGLEEVYKVFVGKVATARSLSVDVVDEIAQGRLWTGKAALNHMLVDALGGFSRAVAIAKLKANIPQNRPINLVELSA